MKVHAAVAVLVLLAAAATEATVGAAGVERDKVIVEIESAFLSAAGRNLHLSADSGKLGWGESQVLELCVAMYQATGERKWLDRLVEHADAILSSISAGPLGLMGWRTTRYSIAFARVSPEPGNRSPARLLAMSEEIWNVKDVAKVTGHRYRVGFPSKARVAVQDVNTQTLVGTAEIGQDGQINLIPGVSLKLEGEPAPEDWFAVETTAPKALDYVVHDGMVLTPIAQFIALTREDGRLARYRETANRLLGIIERHLAHKWDGHWKEIGEGRGAYLAPKDSAQRYGGCTLPHNQYAALGRTFVALWRATRNPWYRDRAQAMALNFKHFLQLDDDHYVWYYWDAAGSWDEAGRRMHQIEDTSHGRIELDLAIDSYEAGTVFDRQDMRRFARTLVSMWNGSRDDPAFAGRVGRSTGPFTFKAPWLRLAEFDDELRDLLETAVSKQKASSLDGALDAAQWMVLKRRWKSDR
jgi:hypothetical protein